MPIIMKDDVHTSMSQLENPPHGRCRDGVGDGARFGQIVSLIFGFNVFVSEPMPMMRHCVRYRHQAPSIQ